jgi:tetratricopeptide (TPR) repeat protein
LGSLKLSCSVALLALPLGAQSFGASGASPAPRTVSVELLRYPLSAKALYMLQKALQISARGDHLGAIKQLQKTLSKCPGTDAYVDSLLGIEYLATSQFSEAVDALEQAVKLLPHDASDHANLGLALVCIGQYDRGKPELDRALELDPHNVTAGRLINEVAREIARK